MKKIIALALCALMVLAMSAVAFAAEENAFEYNFEDDFEGDFIAIDNSIKFYPKQGKVEIAKFDGDLCARIDHTGYEDVSGQMDNYVDFVAGGVSTWGVDPAFVLEYSVYFETAEEGMAWQICCARETPAAGTQFQNTGYFRVKEGKNIITGITADGEVEFGTFELGKWINVAVAVDKANAVFSLYIDGVCLFKDYDYTIADNSAPEVERIRTSFTSFTGDAVAYLDDIKIYNATTPRNVKVAEPAATTAPETAAPETTAAPVTTAAQTAAQTQAPAVVAPSTPAAPTADIAVVLAAVSAIAASGVVVFKKRH
ncbi:MAG: hypothetical protein IJD06_10350 [Clostridia bacterium]|nr:hypothetical protein [Clostridia bacterium]